MIPTTLPFCRVWVLSCIGVVFAASLFAGPVGLGQTPARGLAFSRDQQVLFLPAGAQKPVVLGTGTSASLSPNGQSVAYLATLGKSLDAKSIRIRAVEGGSSRTIHQSAYRLRNLFWSRQGSMLFLMWRGDKDELHIVKPGLLGAKAKSTRVAVVGQNAPNGLFNPRWAPDGKSILFHDLTNVFRMDLSGKVVSKWTVAKITGKPNNVDSGCSFVINPANPKEIAYTCAVQGTKAFEDAMNGEPNSALFVIDLSTGKRRRLTPPDMVSIDPAWTADGRTIYLCGYREPHYRQQYPFRIYRVQSDGSGLKELLKGEQPSP